MSRTLSSWRSVSPNSSKVTSPSSLSRPRRALETASGASLISLAMKCGNPPFWAWLISHLTSITLGLTAVPPIVLTSGPSLVTDTISPSPSSRTFFVYGITLREDHHRVGASQLRECLTDGRHQVTLVELLDQVRHHLRIRLGDEHVALRLQVLPQLGEVLDDAVVDHHDLFVTVGMRVRVDDRGTAVRRPAGMADAEPADRHLLGEALDQRIDLGGALYDGGLAIRLVEDGDPGGIIAAVLEPLEALHDNRRRRALAQVANNPAHTPRPPMFPFWTRSNERTQFVVLGKRAPRRKVTGWPTA